jgi:predicted O-methyltransferase YrrM
MKVADRRLRKAETNQALLPAKAVPSSTTELFNKISEIPGWFTFDDCTHFSLCLGFQHAIGVTGDMMEIGTYHGRSTAVMASGLNAGERLLICDLFEDGPPLYGNRPTAETTVNNILRVNPGLSPEAIKTVKGDSTQFHLAPEERFRFIHVDGGHTYAECLSDLRFSVEHLINNGIMVADDYMHPDWPEVSRAIDDFLKERKDIQIISDLNRIGIVGRKVYLVRRY